LLTAASFKKIACMTYRFKHNCGVRSRWPGRPKLPLWQQSRLRLLGMAACAIHDRYTTVKLACINPLLYDLKHCLKHVLTSDISQRVEAGAVEPSGSNPSTTLPSAGGSTHAAAAAPAPPKAGPVMQTVLRGVEEEAEEEGHNDEATVVGDGGVAAAMVAPGAGSGRGGEGSANAASGGPDASAAEVSAAGGGIIVQYKVSACTVNVCFLASLAPRNHDTFVFP
jgi:hypothetical protein